MGSWNTGTEIPYGDMAGITLPLSDIDPIWAPSYYNGEFSFQYSGRWSEDTLYLLPHPSSQITTWQPLLYFNVVDNNDNVVGYIAVDYKSYNNNRGEWMGEFKFSLKDASFNEIIAFRNWMVGGFSPVYHDGIYFTIGITEKEGHTFYWFASNDIRTNVTPPNSSVFGYWVRDDNSYLRALGTPDIPVDTSSPEFGKKAKRKGGYNPDHHRKGTFDDSSDKITVSNKPGTSPFSTGFIHGYTVNRTQLAGFSQALFPTPPSSFADIPGAIMGLITTLMNNKKPDYILDFLIVPVVPSTGSEEIISLGGSYLQYADDQGLVHFVHGDPIDINSCYVDHDCGSITIPEYWANFLDFSGSRFKLFLPYVGYVDVQPEYINGGNLHVWYRFNVFDGSFMCYVESTSGHSELDESLIAQYAGVAAVHIPVQARDYSNKISGLISAMGVVAAGATGGVSAASGMGAAASLGNTMVQKPGSTHANGYNASSSFLSHRKPYLIIERQSSQFSEKYPEEKGLPLFMESKLGDCHGLTVCDNPHLDTIPATMEEKEKIFKYLTEGVIV